MISLGVLRGEKPLKQSNIKTRWVDTTVFGFISNVLNDPLHINIITGFVIFILLRFSVVRPRIKTNIPVSAVQSEFHTGQGIILCRINDQTDRGNQHAKNNSKYHIHSCTGIVFRHSVYCGAQGQLFKKDWRQPESRLIPFVFVDYQQD